MFCGLFKSVVCKRREIENWVVLSSVEGDRLKKVLRRRKRERKLLGYDTVCKVTTHTPPKGRPFLLSWY